MNLKQMICIVPRGESDNITKAAVKAGAAGGSVVLGRGTAQNSIIQLLGLGDTAKELVYIVLTSEIYQAVKDSITEVTASKKNYGVCFYLDLTEFVKLGQEPVIEQETKMNNQNEYEVINIIVNKGYAEDAMAVARKAGAGGGTILAARGTAKENDPQFLGMKIVPEKEMLMILIPCEKKQAVIDAINGLDCFKEPGSGIIFCNSAHDFTVLGKK